MAIQHDEAEERTLLDRAIEKDDWVDLGDEEFHIVTMHRKDEPGHRCIAVLMTHPHFDGEVYSYVMDTDQVRDLIQWLTKEHKAMVRAERAPQTPGAEAF